MKQHRLTISLGLIAAGSILSLLSNVLQKDILLWLRLLCYLVAMVLSIQEVASHFTKKNHTSP